MMRSALQFSEVQDWLADDLRGAIEAALEQAIAERHAKMNNRRVA